MSKPVIFLSNFHPFISRNIFDSGIVNKIAEASDIVVVFVLKHKEIFLKKKYEKQNIIVVGIDLQSEIHGRRLRYLSRYAELLLNTRTKALHQKIYFERDHRLFKYLFARFTMATLGNLPFARKTFRSLTLFLHPISVFDSYYEKYHPEITVSTDPFSPYDILLMKNARKFPTKLIGFIRSWDNFTTKEYLQVRPDKTIVQNEDMSEEALKYHDIKGCVVVGVPQFEYYLRYTPISRKAFCEKMGLDPKKKIVLFSPAGDKFSSTDWQICELLKQGQMNKRIPADLQFIIRLHPMNPADLSKFVPTKQFVVDDPNSSYYGDHAKEYEMGIEHVNHLADSLFHCDLILNSVSSLIIDAAIFDKPIVTISFDGWEKNVSFSRSVLTEQSNEWLQVLLDKGLSPKATNVEEMYNLINQYLEYPELDREKRAQFVESHCYKLDGKAPERIINAILGGITLQE